MKISSIKDVVDWRLCLGCGACAYICPDDRIALQNIVDQGIRPFIETGDCSGCTACLQVCPAAENDHREINERPGLIQELVPGFGPVLEVWEGFATDEEIRFQGSSGGLLTAMSLYCLEREAMDGVLHIGSDSENPLANKTRMSRSREELLSCSGSRYAPASACDSLELIESAPAPCVFIGQPTEISAMRKAQQLRPELQKKVGLSMSFFCAGSPAIKGTLDLLRSKEIDPEDVLELRYRGLGWPGMFAVRRKSDPAIIPLMTYQESWGFVQRYRPFGIHLCPDISGEDADISCGDPWYKEVRQDRQGFSLVLVRTERGRELLQRAVAAGYVSLKKAGSRQALDSQKGLLRRRGAIWGRLQAMRLMGVPTPALRGFSLFSNWMKLPAGEKIKSFLGTARRIIKRGYWRRMPARPETETPATKSRNSTFVDA